MHHPLIRDSVKTFRRVRSRGSQQYAGGCASVSATSHNIERNHPTKHKSVQFHAGHSHKSPPNEAARSKCVSNKFDEIDERWQQQQQKFPIRVNDQTKRRRHKWIQRARHCGTNESRTQNGQFGTKQIADTGIFQFGFQHSSGEG